MLFHRVCILKLPQMLGMIRSENRKRRHSFVADLYFSLKLQIGQNIGQADWSLTIVEADHTPSKFVKAVFHKFFLVRS